MSDIKSWSWGDIIAVYRILGSQLSEYKRIAEFIDPHQYVDLNPKPGAIIPIAKFEHALWVGAWHRSVTRINEQIDCLDKEIARRNNLIGVMG